jgi:hypothetical protein
MLLVVGAVAINTLQTLVMAVLVVEAVPAQAVLVLRVKVMLVVLGKVVLDTQLVVVVALGQLEGLQLMVHQMQVLAV